MQVEAFIMRTFPGYTLDKLDSLDGDRVWELAGMAQWILEKEKEAVKS